MSHCEEDDDPGAGVVVLAVGVEEADGVEEGRVERPHVSEVCRLKGLTLRSKLVDNNSSEPHLEMCDQRHQMESYVRGLVKSSHYGLEHSSRDRRQVSGSSAELLT